MRFLKKGVEEVLGLESGLEGCQSSITIQVIEGIKVLHATEQRFVAGCSSAMVRGPTSYALTRCSGCFAKSSNPTFSLPRP